MKARPGDKTGQHHSNPGADSQGKEEVNPRGASAVVHGIVVF